VLAQRAAAEPRRRVARVVAAEGDDQPGEVDRHLRSDLLDRNVLSFDPREHGPRERESLRRLAPAARSGHGEWKRRREDREPLELTFEALDLVGLAGQPDELVDAEPVVRVVGAEREDRLDRQLSPLGEAAGDEALHEGRVGVDLVRVHPGGQPPP
jgi:hypothetical protein